MRVGYESCDCVCRSEREKEQSLAALKTAKSQLKTTNTQTGQQSASTASLQRRASNRALLTTDRSRHSNIEATAHVTMTIPMKRSNKNESETSKDVSLASSLEDSLEQMKI